VKRSTTAGLGEVFEKRLAIAIGAEDDFFSLPREVMW
jgi:hypothetical protein